MVVAHFLLIQNGMMQIQLVQNIEVQMDERDRPQNGLHINWYLVLLVQDDLYLDQQICLPYFIARQIETHRWSH